MNVNTPHTMRVRYSLLAAFIGLHVVFFGVLADARGPGSLTVQNQLRTAPTLSQVMDMSGALLERKQMMSGSLQISFLSPTETGAVATLNFALKDHPLWIIFDVSRSKARAVIDAEQIKQYLISYPVTGIPTAQSCSVLSQRTDEEGVIRAQTDCTARSGYEYSTDELVLAIAKAFEAHESTLEFPLTPVTATVMDASGHLLTLLSTGHSTFEGSGFGRKSNVRKGLNERVHNVVVPAGGVFSFNDTLGIVSTSRGWHLALTIFEGVNLRPAPGGGICQVSTTMYRAALAAGFPILEQKNHSLYVTYYEKYGVGQDATIFPGKQNMKFLNDSGGPIIIQAYNDGDEAYVNIYGYDDGRRVTLSGPYFSKTSGPDALGNGKPLRTNEIGWIRTVTMPGAEPVKDIFVARYNALPKSLAGRSTLTTTVPRPGVSGITEQLADR